MTTDTASAPAPAQEQVHSGPIGEIPPSATAYPVPIAKPGQSGDAAHPPIAGEREPTSPLVAFSPAEIEIIKHTYMPGASDDELSVFIKVCVGRQLNPFTRQIYAIQRRQKRNGQWVNVWSHQTSIDGFRLVAERTKRYRGQTVPLFCGEDGVWTETWLRTVPPSACKLGVLRADFDAPIYAVALWREYVQTFEDGNPMAMWAKMPSVMLAKVAEALALRKAFPEELSGLYTSDEMAQSDSDRVEARTAATTQAGESGADPYTGAGSGARPAGRSNGASATIDVYAAIDAQDPELAIPLEAARLFPLVGSPAKGDKPASWGGKARMPLGEISADVLKRAFVWFGDRLEEHGHLDANDPRRLNANSVHRYQVMRAAIPVVVTHLERAQAELNLQEADGQQPKPGQLTAHLPFVTAGTGAIAATETTTPSNGPLGTSTAPAVVQDTAADSLEDVQRALKEKMDHPLMPAPARRYLGRRVADGHVSKNITAAKLHLAIARACLEIGDELVHVQDPRVEKEVLSLLEQSTSYTLKTLNHLLDQLVVGSPLAGTVAPHPPVRPD